MISKQNEKLLIKRWLNRQKNKQEISNVEIHIFSIDKKNTFAEYQFSISYQIQMGCVIEFAEENGLRDEIEYDCAPEYYGRNYD